jgi:hypothetical protein
MCHAGVGVRLTPLIQVVYIKCDFEVLDAVKVVPRKVVKPAGGSNDVIAIDEGFEVILAVVDRAGFGSELLADLDKWRRSKTAGRWDDAS